MLAAREGDRVIIKAGNARTKEPEVQNDWFVKKIACMHGRRFQSSKISYESIDSTVIQINIKPNGRDRHHHAPTRASCANERAIMQTPPPTRQTKTPLLQNKKNTNNRESRTSAHFRCKEKKSGKLKRW